MKTKPSAQTVLAACKPRPEVLAGELDDAIFAADFGQLIDGTAPKVYGHAETFVRNTEPTPDLKAVCTAVFKALADKKEAGQLIRLSTGFGGGKTHTLMALWHLARNIDKLSFGTDLLPAAGRPRTVKVVAVDAAKAGIPVFATHGATKTHSLQGEIICQLGGTSALKALGAADHHEASPDDATITKTIGNEPLLILLDELVIYMAGLSAAGQGNFMSFLGKLISAVSRRKQAVLVITDPGQQAAYAGVSAQLATAIGAASVKLEDILGRKMTDFDPVGKQAARVIARRLFEKIDPLAAARASAKLPASEKITAALRHAQKEAERQVGTMESRASEIEHSSLSAQHDAAALRLGREAGRLLRCLDESSADLAHLFESEAARTGPLAERLREAKRRLGDGFRWDEHIRWELQQFLKDLTANDRKSRLSGSSIDAAFADYRWLSASS